MAPFAEEATDVICLLNGKAGVLMMQLMMEALFIQNCLKLVPPKHTERLRSKNYENYLCAKFKSLKTKRALKSRTFGHSVVS